MHGQSQRQPGGMETLVGKSSLVVLAADAVVVVDALTRVCLLGKEWWMVARTGTGPRSPKTMGRGYKRPSTTDRQPEKHRRHRAP